MADVIFVGVLCAFFALCTVYIRWCDRIIGPDDAIPSVATRPDGHDADLAAPTVGASA